MDGQEHYTTYNDILNYILKVNEELLEEGLHPITIQRIWEDALEEAMTLLKEIEDE